LHADLQDSSDAVMLHLNSNSNTRAKAQACTARPLGALEQERSRDAGGRTLVRFGSAAAVGDALAQAAVVQTVALERAMM
jgi:hypothetical protein